MAATTSTIGTGKTYSTIAAWEDAQDANPNNQDTGSCEAEAFAAVAFDGGTYTATNYPHLTSKVGAEHDGRANEVSGAGNARIEWTNNVKGVLIQDDFVRVSWMELKGPGNNDSQYAIFTNFLTTCTIHVHHNIIHNNDASTGDSEYGIYTNDADASTYIYRNIVYGHHGSGIQLQVASNTSVVLCNTTYYNNHTNQYRAGIGCGVAAAVVADNASFANRYRDFYNTTGVMDYNASADTTADAEGANSIANLTTADQFVAPDAADWTKTDLLLVATSDLIGEGTDLTSATYPEIEYPIHSRSVAVTGTWDIGADQYVATGGPVALTATVACASTVAAVLDAGTTLAGSAAGSSSVTGVLDAGTVLAGTITGASTVVASLDVPTLMTATVVGQATVLGVLDSPKLLAGSATGTSTVAGVLDAGTVLVGTITGASTVIGSLTSETLLIATAAGAATVVGVLDAGTDLAGTAAGTSTVSGVLFTGTTLVAAVVVPQSTI